MRLKDKKYLKKLITLFLSTLYLSTFTFGGGYVIVTLLKQKFVDDLHWLDDDEMLDLSAIAQSAPGAIAVNGAIVVGYKICGIPGIFVSVAGAIIPPFVIIGILSVFYNLFKTNNLVRTALFGMKIGVCAVIAYTVLDMISGIIKDKDFSLFIIMVAAFGLNYFLNINVVIILLAVIAIGILEYVIEKEKNK